MVRTLNATYIGGLCKQVHTYLSSRLCAHLKGAPEGEREGPLQVPLLWAPALADLVVTHHHLLAALVETWVDVKGNVVASQKVHGEPGKEIRGAWTDIQYMLTFSDCKWYVCVCVCVLRWRERRTEIWRVKNPVYIFAFGFTWPRMVIIILSYAPLARFKLYGTL